MNLKNLLTLTIRPIDFNLAIRQPVLLEKLRILTLNSSSGMNWELSALESLAKERSVNCKLLLAYRSRVLVGWGILTQETSTYPFNMSYNQKDGRMFQVYVEPSYRQQGIATALFKKASKISGKEILCVCPWDNKGHKFYARFDKRLMKFL